MQDKVLIFYVNPNSGHHRAAISLKNAFHKHSPQTEVLLVDFMKHINPVVAQVLLKSYKNIIKRSPDYWRYLYDNPDVVRRTQKLRGLLVRTNLRGISKLIKEHQPRALICTQAIPCGSLAYYKRKKRLEIPLTAVSTDFTLHSYWIHEGVDHYVVPSEREKAQLLGRSVDEAKIYPIGIPIDPKFAEKLDHSELQKKFELDPKRFTVLVMGGSQGLGKIREIASGLLLLGSALQLIVVTGTNKSLYKYFSSMQGDQLKLFAHVDNVHELMEVSDMIITKPGGLTVAECMSKNCPMVLINPIPGQEVQNAQFLSDREAAVLAHDDQDVQKFVAHILENRDQVKAMSFHYDRLKKPNAAQDIAQMVLKDAPI